jgi:predicted nucleotide-binding protein
VAPINPKLLDQLKKRLNVSKTRVYTLIQEISTKNRVPRRIGALLLAGDNGLSMEKYATEEDLRALSGRPTHVTVETPVAEPAPAPRIKHLKPTKAPRTQQNSIFVVHGRDSKLRDSMYDFLGALGLRPLEWGHAIRAAIGKRGGNPYVNDAVNKIMAQAQAIVVLLSPDDEVRLREQFVQRHEQDEEGKFRFQARPNVIFETGIAVGTHHSKTLIIQVGAVKPFTDIGGMHVLHLTGDDKSRNAFAERLEALGCKINRTGDRWLSAGDFKPTQPKRKRRKKRR